MCWSIAASTSSGRSSRSCPSSPWETQVGRLRCLRGVDTLTAVGLCAEVGDFERFARAEQLMSYLGLVPSESTTGNTRRLGSITKTGSAHARRLLVEAAWHYRKAPAIAQDPDRATGGPTARSGRDRLDRATPAASHLDPARSAQPSAARSSRSPPPASSSGSAGRSPKSNSQQLHHHIPRSAGSVAARDARGTRDVPMSNPSGGHARSHRQRHPTTNHGPAATRIREYQSDPRRAQQPGPPPTQPTPHHPPDQRATARNSHAPA